MADSGSKFPKEQQLQEPQQSTAEWLYDTVASFLPSWSGSNNTQTEKPAAQQQQAPEGSCPKTAAPVCHCKNKNRF